MNPVQGPPEEDLNKDGTDIVSFAESGIPAVTSGQEQSFAEEFEHIIPDHLDKSVATILSRYSKHNDYTFTSTDYYWSVYFLIQQMQQFHKLDGYYGFTATYSMKIVWNSDPFIQGIYMLAYLLMILYLWIAHYVQVVFILHSTWIVYLAHQHISFT